MTSTSTFLPNPINLPGGLVARIELIPMPQADDQGQYQPCLNTDIQVSLFRNDQLIERRQWDTLVCGAAAVTLVDGSTLDGGDLKELDSTGWDQMAGFGMVPAVWVEPEYKIA